MTRQEIQAFFPSGVPMFFGGMEFAVPTEDWLLEGFAPWFLSELQGAGVGSWSQRWECRDFARAFACLAQLENAKATGSPAGSDALAVGEIWFHPDGNPLGQDHAINVCVTDRGLITIEPQTGKLRPLSPNETLLIKYVRF